MEAELQTLPCSPAPPGHTLLQHVRTKARKMCVVCQTGSRAAWTSLTHLHGFSTGHHVQSVV